MASESVISRLRGLREVTCVQFDELHVKFPT